MDDLERRRQDALDALARGYADGLLDDAVFDRAVAEVTDAPDAGAVSAALDRHLPARNTTHPPGAGTPDPGQSISAILTERTMQANWLRHRYTTATAVMGTLTIDLRDAEITSDVQLHVVCIMGELKVLLPPGYRVENEISVILAEHNDRSRGTGGNASGGPTIRLTGTAVLAEVTIS